MEVLDISQFDMGDFDVLGSSVQKFIDDSFNADYFNLDIYDTSDETSENSFLDEDQQQQSERKRKLRQTAFQHEHKLSRPRIVKSDFRRNFAQIWAGVFNSTDYETMMGHLKSFYDIDVSVYQNDLRRKNFHSFHFSSDRNSLVVHYLSAEDLSYGSKSRGPIVGYDYLSELWYRSMQIAPDQVCVLKHTFVKVRSDGTSLVKFTFCLEGTKVVKVENASEDLKDTVVCVRPASYDATGSQVHGPTFRNLDTSSPDDLDRFVSSDSTESICSSILGDILTPDEALTAAFESTDPLQNVLHRYLKASDAVIRSKSKEGTRKRRKREKNAEPALPVAVEEWLSRPTTEVLSMSKGNDSAPVRARPVRPIQYARIVDNVAYIRPVDTCTLRGDNDSNLPLVRAYKVEHQKGEVVLTAPLKSTCSLELNFNANHRIVSVTLNFIE